jgi:hypothetical protein
MLRLTIAFLLLALISNDAMAEKRVALVIGNAAYKNASELLNPRNDAVDIAATVRALGFDVIDGGDLDKAGMERLLREFARRLEGADVGLFFYAGHGLQVKGVNYLVGIDAKLEAERDLDFETMKIDAVLAHMEREAKTNIVFLDACRNNPLTRNLARTMGTRAVNEKAGLAPIASGLGTFIAFATQPGNVASDGAGRNSPFTAALKKHIAAPGVPLGDIMIEVRRDVVAATNGAQVPWDHSALQGRFYFKPPPPSLPPAAEAWDRVKDTNNAPVLEAFLARYKDTIYADLARARLENLKTHEQSGQPVLGESAEAATKRAAIETEALHKAQQEWLNRKEIRVALFISVNMQCQVLPPAIVEIVKAPLYGTLAMRVEEGQTGKSIRKEFDHCTGTKGKGRAVYYVIKEPERHRKGSDTFSVRVVRAGGNIDIQEYEINLEDRTSTRTKVTLVR